MKAMVLLGAKPGQSDESFRADYIKGHAATLAAKPAVDKLTANLLCEPTEEMIAAGWGWGGKDDTGVLAIDEVWTDGDVLELYADANVIGAYECNELSLRDCVAKWPLGTKSHWVKRMGLLKCFDEQRPEDFFQYWAHIHSPKALKHHIGAGKYFQNHFINTIKAAPAVWNGSMSLCYWNVDAFQFGHFSQPDSRAVIAEDGTHFMDRFLALYAEEYIMK